MGAYDPAFTGPDPDLYETVLDAQWGGSVVSVTNAGDVTLKHLIITHGDGSGNCGSYGCGGGIYIEDTTVRIESCSIHNNLGSSDGTQGAGGGAYVANWSSSLFADIKNTTFFSNVASTASTGWGGGMYLNAGSVMTPAAVNGNLFESQYRRHRR